MGQLINYSEPFLITFLHHDKVYSYVVKRADVPKAIPILKLNIGPLLKMEATDKMITHSIVVEDGINILLSEK